MIAPFGKIHKYDNNLFKKKRADVVRVMVEVEDILVVPKVIRYSYKALTDNKFRFYDVKVIPSPTCLPVSQWTDENYKAYEEDGGSRDSVEERCEDVGESARGQGAERRAGNAEDVDMYASVAEGNAPHHAKRGAGIQEETRAAAHAEGQEGASQGGERMHAFAVEKAEDTERRRKGKGILTDWAQGSGPDPLKSGSGSHDPDKGEGAQADPIGQHSSDDADFKAGPTADLGTLKEKPIIISDGSQQDEDLGGEGGRGGLVAPEGGWNRLRKVDEGEIKPAPSQGKN